MKTPSRIVEHLRVRAGDLEPHPLNPRVHPDSQKAALRAALARFGIARSVLARRLPTGRLQLIDGHLRASLDAETVLDVEVVEVGEQEARELLLTLDPLAALAETDAETLAALAELCPADDEALKALWHGERAEPELPQKPEPEWERQWLVMVRCESESAQGALLEELARRGLDCRALTS
ncbi:MAG: hypothetical protein KJS91_15910 [Planctomycetes bacterium]|nr:hypothetical protein [Planctomycetota bacterium]